ncbi:MAG TPA: acyl-CoA dehydrogenase family protein [Candidatus Binatia bacterium]|nr:acyl-CoA dehydrogenase family protein [Candidatus Binatia bacterium]
METPRDDVLASARALQEPIRARAREIELARRLPADLARAFAERGLYRLAVPRSLGGLEADPERLFEAIELIAEADASAGWCLMIGVTTGVVSAYLAPAVAREAYGDPLAITGGVYAPMGQAIRDGDAYRVSGRWQWASGSANCSWLVGGCAIVEDGKPRLLPNGMLDARMAVFPAADATLIDSWHVAGLCGTGSGEMEVRDLRVPIERSVSIVTDVPVERGPLYRFPVFGLLALGIAAVALGNARGAIAELAEIASGKKPYGSARSLAERANVQAAFAEAAARLEAARALYRQSIADAWRRACDDGEVSVRDRAALRLAATHATRVAADVTRVAYDLAGGTSPHLVCPLQRRFRDAHVATQHVMVAPATYELAGRALLGLPTDATML